MKTLHITGFADFWESKSLGTLPNTSRLVVEMIADSEGLGKELAKRAGADRTVTHVLPVPRAEEGQGAAELFEAFKGPLQKVLDAIDPRKDALIALGQGSIRQRVALLEKEFTNVFKVGDSDEFPILPNRPPMQTFGPGEENTQVLVEGVRALGGGLEGGINAGTFYCNWVGAAAYDVLGERAGLVHLQAMPDAKLAGRVWDANSKVETFRNDFPNREDVTHANVWSNLTTVRRLLTAWKPFELK